MVFQFTPATSARKRVVIKSAVMLELVLNFEHRFQFRIFVNARSHSRSTQSSFSHKCNTYNQQGFFLSCKQI